MQSADHELDYMFIIRVIDGFASLGLFDELEKVQCEIGKIGDLYIFLRRSMCFKEAKRTAMALWLRDYVASAPKGAEANVSS